MGLRIAPWLVLLLLAAGCDGGPGGAGGGLGLGICGNGHLEGRETCDDGNTATERCRWNAASCEICDATCQLVPGETTRCGDGTIDPIFEGCDDGNDVTETCAYGRRCSVCDATCQLVEVLRICGDGVVDGDAGERCDDGPANDDERPGACRTDCRPAHCGDGVLDEGEGCEPPGQGRCRADCTVMGCGDGVVDPGEACDPGDPAGLPCRADCTVPVCGDGRLDPGEACDDGDVVPRVLAGGAGGACLLDEAGSVRCVGGALEAVPAEVAAGGAVALDVGTGWACALLEGGDARCWGAPPSGDATLAAPPGPFSSIALGHAHACAIRPDRSLICWGQLHGASPSAEEGWAEVVAGHGFSCGRRASGEPECWGTPTFGIQNVPDGFFRALAAGENHACGIRNADGYVVCWGDGRSGQLAAPERLLFGLALGPGRSCAFDRHGALVCWGKPLDPRIPAPEGTFERLVHVGDLLCADGPEGLRCWGDASPVLAGLGNLAAPGACRAGCEAPACGDGLLDPGETCDDGDTVDGGNGCGATCGRIGSCGDGLVQPAFESCDWGDAGPPPACGYGMSCERCDESCRSVTEQGPRCGDGWLDAGEGEGCDDGGEGPLFGSISLGWDSGCGLREDGTARCWGALAGEKPPEGTFVQVAASSAFACALDAEGGLHCWGELPAGLPAGGRYVALDAGPGEACAIDTEGGLHCWGTESAPPAGTFRQVSVGEGIACALDDGGAITCWGARAATPPAGRFTALAVGGGQHCAIDAGGLLSCWGENDLATVPTQRVRAASSGTDHTCVIDATDRVLCFGPSAPIPEPGRYRSVTAAGDWACALAIDGKASCWGLYVQAPVGNDDEAPDACRIDCSLPACGDGVEDRGEICDAGNLTVPECPYGRECTVCGPTCELVPGLPTWCGDGIVNADSTELCDAGPGNFNLVARGDGFTCGLTLARTIHCWGRNDLGQSEPPAGRWQGLAVGARHACTADAAGQPICWGANDLGQLEPPAGAALAQLVAGRDFTCGRRLGSGELVCWGDVPFVPPATGAWTSLAAGDRHLCAVESVAWATTGAVHCWGENDHGQATPPAGTFGSLAAGRRHTCATNSAHGGGVTCWGDDSAGQSSPPADLGLVWGGVAAGSTQSCAIDPFFGAALRCWGTPADGAGVVPDHAFHSVSLPRWGPGFACGIVSGDLICWGGAGDPAATPPAGNSNLQPDGCRNDCRPARCGDGVVDSGESCDDRNLADGDGCSGTCTVEST